MEGQNKLEQGKKQDKLEDSRGHHKNKTIPPHHKRHLENKDNVRNLGYFDKPHQKKEFHHANSRHFQHKEKRNENENHFNKQVSQHNNKPINNIKQASETAKNKLSDALNKKANSVVSVSKEGDNWIAVIEIVDEEYLPGKNLQSMSDIIGIYEVKLSNNGELLSWNKKSSRKRGNVSV